MNNDVFYNFRTQIRKKLGRIFFYPEDTNFYDDVIQIIESNEDIFKKYLNCCTENERKVLLKVLCYLKHTNKNIEIEEWIEKGIL